MPEIRLDFGPINSSDNWNNVAVNDSGEFIADCVEYYTGDSTGIRFDLDGQADGSIDNGEGITNTPLDYSDLQTRDAFFCNQDSRVAEYRFSGLPANEEITMRVWGESVSGTSQIGLYGVDILRDAGNDPLIDGDDEPLYGPNGGFATHDAGGNDGAESPATIIANSDENGEIVLTQERFTEVGGTASFLSVLTLSYGEISGAPVPNFAIDTTRVELIAELQAAELSMLGPFGGDSIYATSIKLDVDLMPAIFSIGQVADGEIVAGQIALDIELHPAKIEYIIAPHFPDINPREITLA